MKFIGYHSPPGGIPVLLLVLLLTSPLLRAQQSVLKFDRISAQQGLSDNYVVCMIQDSRGLIWFGTRDGLNRYDGYTFTTYRHDIHDPNSISDGGVDCMIEDREGKLWVGTRGGGHGFQAFAGLDDVERLDQAYTLNLRHVEPVAEDLMVVAYWEKGAGG